MLKENFVEEKQNAFSDYETERNKPMPSFNHGSIQANLIIEFAAYRKKYRPVSELSLNLSDWPSVPDISLYPWKKLDFRNDTIKMEAPPLCAVEILSPTQSLTELISNTNGYFEHGVKTCWIVFPAFNNIYVFYSPGEYDIFRTGEKLVDKILEIKIDVAKVFE